MIVLEGIDDLIADLTERPIRVQAGALAVVNRAAERGAEEARRLAPRHGLPHYVDSITAEAWWDRGAAVGEFGPERGGQGSLAHILEFGTAKSPPHAHIGPAFDRGQPDFIDDVGRLA